MNILFYFPTSERSISLETLMEEFSKMGHTVFLLGWDSKGPIHTAVEQFGVSTQTFTPKSAFSPLFYFEHMRYLASYCKRHQIDLVYSHTQPVNFVSVFAQFFVKAKFYICRHHSDYIMNGSNNNAKRFDKIINRFGKRFIVPSKKVYHQLVEVEGVKNKEVRLINYAYRFENYPALDEALVLKIKKASSGKITLCAVSRFIPCKRYDLLIDTISEMVAQGLPVHINILGVGPLLEQVKTQVANLDLQDHVTFVGFTKRVLEYMNAADLVVHFSDSEASNSVIKEAGILEKPVAVCNDVGDFDDYIRNGIEGFVMSKENPKKELIYIVEQINTDKEATKTMGVRLKKSVLQNFSVENVIQAYSEVYS